MCLKVGVREISQSLNAVADADSLRKAFLSSPEKPGPKVIANDEQGDPLYEDVGLTPKLVALTRRYRRELDPAAAAQVSR